MKSQITMAQLKTIYEERDVFLSERNAAEMLKQCNDQADEIYHHYSTGKPLPPRTATQWAEYYADGEAHQNDCDARAHAQFCHDAYGDD
ncbi:hypothetical protein HLB25_21405 [Dickeya dadantii]|uniref:hypothetical protein n=1 Tax=Dickeya dadantii TaxID=204038 RepID=UPI001495BD5F|nr:hypothetical protein [Dickeya dadantii]NPE57104.1 hypothetical protein [Dickeya dadantii]NPE69066.1 hypothetical protein [Dickeya dadantii]